MVNLDISNQRQAPKSTLCGPICVKMILDHIGMEEGLDQVCTLCGWEKRGTFETSIVLGLFALGIPSTLLLEPDGEKIWPKYLNKPLSKVVTSLRQRSRKSKAPVEQRGYDELAEGLSHGLIEFGIATRKRIEKELDAGNPWIVSVSAFHMYDKNEEDSYKNRGDLQHFVIIQGYDEDNFFINDPAYGEEGGIYAVEKDRLLYAMYRSDGGAMCVEVSNVADIRSHELVYEGGID